MLRRAAWGLAAISLAVALVSVIVFLVGTTGIRWPYFGEAETVFEAARLRAGLPLYVDPLVGAREYGVPYSRFYVTYPPLFALVVRLLPESVALVGSRIVSILAWAGSLAWLVASARPGCRRNAAASAIYVGGLWILANFAGTGRPDAFACALATFGLVRTIRRGRVDWLAALLLVLAPWTKPSLLGLPAGVLLFDALARRKVDGLLRALSVMVAIGLALGLATDGQVFVHSFLSMAQPLAFANWLANVPARAPFFFPLFALAIVFAWRRRSEHAAFVGLGAIVTATAWVLFSFAKTGSAANYWMEPCLAAIAVLAHVEGPYVFGKGGPVAAVATAMFVIYADVGAVEGSFSRLASYRREAVFLASARARCHAGPKDVITADVSGIELALNGRIIAPAYQMTYLALAGKYPVTLWLHDLESPRVHCHVRTSPLLDALPSIASYLNEELAPVAREGDLELLERRR